MRKTSDIHLKKGLTIAVFIFLFGLFSGLFFSMGLSEENSGHLSSLLISSITDENISSLRILLSSMFSNLTIAALMLAAVLSSLLCFLPFALLWYKSFSIGFCCGLINMSGAENVLTMSLTEILPPAVFLIPAFVLLTAAAFSGSKNQVLKSKRPSREKKDLQSAVFISLAAIAVGCFTEAICHML